MSIGNAARGIPPLPHLGNDDATQNIHGWETSKLMEAGFAHGPLWLGENYPWHVEYLETLAIGTLPTGFPRFNSPAGVSLVVALINFDREAELDYTGEKIDLLQSDIERQKKEISVLNERRQQLRAHGYGQDIRTQAKQEASE